MQIQINDQSAEKRALHITVGAALLAVVFYLWFSGWFSATVSLPMPVQEDGRLSVGNSWFAQTAGDALAFLGALAIAISSGLAKFGIQVVAFFANRISNQELSKASNVYTDEMIARLVEKINAGFVSNEKLGELIKKINATFATKQSLQDESAALDTRIEQAKKTVRPRVAKKKPAEARSQDQ